ncbi:hypothetical protein F8M41_025458 [Gigaspora margarita]|uniref:Uncharacterized protein n=1 Tax=Gigaspora margarita TaxID=4874 RepID=A0A8H4B022_GIGMA|nr:hypothetical protein F8M41_025458 [Gigaspora margarita]
MFNNSISKSYSLTKWAPILSTDIYGFLDKEIELAHSHLKEKQCYTKVFELARTLVNKAVELKLDEQLVTLLEGFRKNEIMPILYQQNQNNSELENDNMRQSGSRQIIVENPIKKRKGHPQEMQRIFSSSKANQQLSAIRKNRCKYCKSESDSNSNNFVTEQHLKRAKDDDSGSESDNMATKKFKRT